MIDAAQYESWLETGFTWLEENWGEQEWAEVQGGFLGALGLASAADDPVVQALVAEIEAVPAEEQRSTVLDAGARGALVTTALAAGEQGDNPAGAASQDAAPASGDADPAAELEPVYVEGTGWMRWDAAANEWMPMDAGDGEPAPPVAPPPPAGSADAPAEGETPPVAPPPPVADADAPLEPATVASNVIEQIALPALSDALAAMPELAAVPSDELNQLLGQVLAERLAAAS
jgi:hypothetical protein